MSPLQSIPPWAIAIILCLLIATFTECTSNVATATLFLPVLASMVRYVLMYFMNKKAVAAFQVAVVQGGEVLASVFSIQLILPIGVQH